MKKIQVNRPSDSRLQELNIRTWSKWESDQSTFDLEYIENEVAYIYEGKVKIKSNWEEIELGAGDLAVFPKGLKCKWEIIDPIKKVYRNS